jgi:hypothetical protein
MFHELKKNPRNVFIYAFRLYFPNALYISNITMEVYKL